MATLQTVSKQMGEVVAAAAPHIVRVEARRRMGATGVVLGNGLIVTASHVVHKEKAITIGLDGGETAVAHLLGRDNTTDLAVLKTDAALAKMPIADEVGNVGNLVMALGRPGHTVQATLGILSAVGGEWRTGMGGMLDHYVQTDVLMYPGFSGGPLINADGHMIGLNSSALMRGVSVTIPAVTVGRVAHSIAEYGHVKRAFLGVSTQIAKLPRAVREELGQKSGLLIVGVEADTPAESAGLVMGDTIVAFEGTAVHNHDDLLAQLTGDRIGKTSAVRVLRGGTLQSVDVVLGVQE